MTVITINDLNVLYLSHIIIYLIGTMYFRTPEKTWKIPMYSLSFKTIEKYDEITVYQWISGGIKVAISFKIRSNN